MRLDYIPQDEGAQSTWAQNFKAAANGSANAAAMGWDTEAVLALQAAAQVIVDGIADKEAAHNLYLAAVAAADVDIRAAEKAIRQKVGSGKEQTTYSEEIGQALGVIGPESGFNPETYVAELRSAEVVGPGQVRLKFGKAGGQVPAVKAQMRRGTSGWTTVGQPMRSPWTDETPLAQPGVPENREYRVRAVKADVEIGQPSPAISVTVG